MSILPKSKDNLSIIEKSVETLQPGLQMKKVKLAYLHSVITLHDLSIAGRSELSLPCKGRAGTLSKDLSMHLESNGLHITNGKESALIPMQNIKALVFE